MTKRLYCFLVNLIILPLILSGCTADGVHPPTRPVSGAYTPTVVPKASSIPADLSALPSELTTTPAPVYLSATRWNGELQAPVVLYHRFLPLNATKPSPIKMPLPEFQKQLQAFYDAGYSLVPMEKWLAGDIHVPAGRRPMILTMDDAFFADQIFLDPNGSPSLRSGMGVLWKFSQDHPNFGFSASLFANLGDKYYGNKKTNHWFRVDKGWEDTLANAIVWCIEHDVLPYNHTYMHSRLDLVETHYLHTVLQQNDIELRKLLTRVHREDLIPSLGNIIALPDGLWPKTPKRVKVFLSYLNPEGKPIQAVMEAGFYYDSGYLAAPFEPHFDAFHINRITVNSDQAVQFLVNHRDMFPVAEDCQIGPADPSDRKSVV
jgi:hypothetical protein